MPECLKLVQVPFQSQMSALAAHICHGQDYVTRQFMLHVQIPLLHVGPFHLVGNRNGT